MDDDPRCMGDAEEEVGEFEGGEGKTVILFLEFAGFSGDEFLSGSQSVSWEVMARVWLTSMGIDFPAIR